MRLATVLAHGADEPAKGVGTLCAWGPRFLARGDVVRCDIEGLRAIGHAIA